MSDTLLHVTDLHKSFGAVAATSDLSLSVRRHTIHALIGPNGAGKTTLVNQITGDILPDSGTILFDGEDITQMKPFHRAHKGIGRSFQITHIFDTMTVAENMALAILAQEKSNFCFWRHSFKTPVVQSNLAQALERVDLLDNPNLLAGNLSHGEKRQLEVGMALVGNPKLLILDEPMAGMGSGGTVELSKLISKLKGSLTILLVEHDMNVIFSLADEITVLLYGTNIAHGTPEEIKADPTVRAAYLGEEKSNAHS